MRLAKIFKNIDPLLIAHHPLCSSFKEDLVSFKGWKICIGCIISYPIAIGIIIGNPFLFYGNWETAKLVKWGVLLGIVQLISTLGLTKFKLIKIIVKISLGLGIGLTTTGILNLHISGSLKLLILICCAQIASILAGLRNRNIKKKCLDCPYNAEWDRCPGYLKTKYNSGIPHQLPIMPPGNSSVKYQDSKNKYVELPVPLK